MSEFTIEIDGFSGPLDLLCHMVDSKEIDAAKISVSDVISIYASYLAENGGLPIAQIADFISQAAHLLRQKASSLLPRLDDDGGADEDYDGGGEVEELLERYRPFREAAAKLLELKERADKRRFRAGEPFEPMYDLGNLYSLSVRWIELLERYRRDRAIARLDETEWEDDGVPAEIPDEVQVESRMERVMERLEAFPEGLSLRFLLSDEPGVAPLVVTLLALLELSRRNRLTLTQEELFADVIITRRAV